MAEPHKDDEGATGGPDTAKEAVPPRELTDAAKRALAEAEERREAAKRTAGCRPKEIGGQQGPDPVRFGDWEKDGICSDF
ncbi:MAG: DUF1674 domain-containing protein [Pseudomonadota bacterium]